MQAEAAAAELALSSILDGASDTPCCCFARLSVPVEWTRYCNRCENQQRFIAYSVCVAGLIASCAACGDQLVAPFTRTTTEAA